MGRQEQVAPSAISEAVWQRARTRTVFSPLFPKGNPMTDGILPDPSSIQRSWQTRMASVIRQFETLTEEILTDDHSGELVDVVGLCKSYGETRLTVKSREGTAGFYSTPLDRLMPWT